MQHHCTAKSRLCCTVWQGNVLPYSTGWSSSPSTPTTTAIMTIETASEKQQQHRETNRYLDRIITTIMERYV